MAFGRFERGGFCGVLSLGFFSRVFVLFSLDKRRNLLVQGVPFSSPLSHFLGFQAKGSKGVLGGCSGGQGSGYSIPEADHESSPREHLSKGLCCFQTRFYFTVSSF